MLAHMPHRTSLSRHSSAIPIVGGRGGRVKRRTYTPARPRLLAHVNDRHLDLKYKVRGLEGGGDETP